MIIALKLIFILIAILIMKKINTIFNLGLLSSFLYLLIITLLFFIDALIHTKGSMYSVELSKVLIYGVVTSVFYIAFLWYVKSKR